MKNILIVLLICASAGIAQTGDQQGVKPDNTKKNAKEQVTAEDQGGSEADREMTKKIRQAIVGANLSTMAKNIKIITMDGKVTLKGPVHSDQEKQTITSLAEKAAGAGKVTNQLEVKKQ